MNQILRDQIEAAIYDAFEANGTDGDEDVVERAATQILAAIEACTP